MKVAILYSLLFHSCLWGVLSFGTEASDPELGGENRKISLSVSLSSSPYQGPNRPSDIGRGSESIWKKRSVSSVSKKKSLGLIEQGARDGKGGQPSHEAPSLDLISSPPRLVGRMAAPYPPESKARGEEGRVLIVAYIDKEGRVSRAELVRSSGYSSLDRSALKTVRESKFIPARIGKRLLEAKKTFSFHFRLLQS